MGPVCALLLLLHIAQAQATDTKDVCDATVNLTHCYGALGGTIKIRLMDNGSMTYRCKWIKNSTETVFEWKDKTGRITDNVFKNRSPVFNDSTGIIQLKNLTKNDSDLYLLRYYVDGKIVKTINHKLIIEAPVFSVFLDYKCVSKGEVRASCSTQGGDSPKYSWTLNRQNLTDSEVVSKSNESTIVTLRQNTEGLLRCSVKNNVSHKFNESQVPNCGYIFINCTLNGTQISEWVYESNNTLCMELTTVTPITPSVGKTPSPSTSLNVQTSPSNLPGDSLSSHFEPTIYLPIIAGSLVAVLITAVVIVCVLKKRKKKRDEDPDQELTYADVRILRQPGPRQQPMSEGEVEYGEVKFSNHTPVEEENACIYSKVRR